MKRAAPQGRRRSTRTRWPGGRCRLSERRHCSASGPSPPVTGLTPTAMSRRRPPTSDSGSSSSYCSLAGPRAGPASHGRNTRQPSPHQGESAMDYARRDLREGVLHPLAVTPVRSCLPPPQTASGPLLAAGHRSIGAAQRDRNPSSASVERTSDADNSPNTCLNCAASSLSAASGMPTGLWA